MIMVSPLSIPLSSSPTSPLMQSQRDGNTKKARPFKHSLNKAHMNSQRELKLSEHVVPISKPKACRSFACLFCLQLLCFSGILVYSSICVLCIYICFFCLLFGSSSVLSNSGLLTLLFLRCPFVSNERLSVVCFVFVL